MSPSIFLYNCNNVSHVIKKIYEIIDFNESTCDIYTIDHISQSPTHCSKVNLKYVLQCTKFPQRQVNSYMFQKNCSSIKKLYMKLGYCFQRERGENNHTCHMFDNNFLESSKKMKLCTRDYIFPTKHYIIRDYNPLCFMSIGLMLDDLIMNLFTDSTKQTTESHQKHFFPKYRMIQFTCTKDLYRILN